MSQDIHSQKKAPKNSTVLRELKPLYYIYTEDSSIWQQCTSVLKCSEEISEAKLKKTTPNFWGVKKLKIKKKITPRTRIQIIIKEVPILA